MRKRYLLPILAITFLMITCITMFQIFTRGCLWWDCAPARSFQVSALNLPAEFFPVNAMVNQLYPISEKEGAVEAMGATNYWNGTDGLSVYSILKYSTERQASERFEYYFEFFFVENLPAPLEQLPQIRYHSEKADEYFVACGDVEFNSWITFRCGLVARYEEFFVFFNSVLDDDMAIQDFEEIIIYIDSKMEELLL